MQRRCAETAAGLRDAALAHDLDRFRAPKPTHPVQQTAQDLTGAKPHVERQGDRVIDHHLGRQIALTLARLARLRQDLLHQPRRERPGDHAKANMVTQANAGGQTGRSTRHR